MAFRDRLKEWLALWLKFYMSPNNLVWIVGGAGSIVLYYAHRPVPSFLVPLSTTTGILLTMLFYRWREAKRLSGKPVAVTTNYFGMDWHYQSRDGMFIRGSLIPLCPQCGTQVQLPMRPPSQREADATPIIIECIRPGCPFRIKGDRYAAEYLDAAERLISADAWKVKDS